VAAVGGGHDQGAALVAGQAGRNAGIRVGGQGAGAALAGEVEDLRRDLEHPGVVRGLRVAVCGLPGPRNRRLLGVAPRGHPAVLELTSAGDLGELTRRPAQAEDGMACEPSTAGANE